MSFASIKRNISVLNIILLVIASVVYWHTIAPLTDLNAGIRIPAPKDIPLSPIVKIGELQPPSLVDFMNVAEKNLFHPERIIPFDGQANAAERRPEIILYGTIVSDHIKIAYTEDRRAGQATGVLPGGPEAATPAGRNKKQRAMKLGENINGYVLKKIEADSVTFVKGEDRIFVSLKDMKNRRQAHAREVKSAAGNPPPMQIPAPPSQPTVPVINRTGTPSAGIPAPAQPRSYSNK